MSFAIGIDVGGTKVLGGIVGSDGEIGVTERRATPPNGGAELVETIAEVARELLKHQPGSPIGISTAGFISSDRRTMYANPNIKNWDGLALADVLEQRVNAKIVIENDANSAAWAEYKFGVGRGSDVMVMLTIGTGVGGGIISRGEIHRGHFGVGAEIGHMRVVPQGDICGCGQQGCFEVYASGSALVRFGKQAMHDDPRATQTLFDLAGGDIDALTGADITNAAQSGDAVAIELFARLGRWIGEGIASINAIIDPELVVIGGGVVDAGDLLLNPIRESFKQSFPSSQLRPIARIVPAQFVNNAGLVGAADLARI